MAVDPLGTAPPRGPSRRTIRRRRIAAVVVLVIVVASAMTVAAVAVSRLGEGGAASPPAAPTTTASPVKQPKPFRIIFPEGFTRAEMADRVTAVAKIAKQKRHAKVALSKPAYLAASRNGVVRCFGRAPRQNLEGFLFPATYDFLRQTPTKKLVRDQVDSFCDNWRRLDLRYARTKNLTRYDVLIIASMIEKEAAVAAERKLVAGVIYNRLHSGMPLGIDATLRYGLDIPPTESIRQSQLQDPTPFNTRLHTGLPPTPIANPGLASLEAAAHPSRLGYLYYARIPGTNRHKFFESDSAFEEYLAANGYGVH